MEFPLFDKLNSCQILSIAMLGNSTNNADRTAIGLYIREEVYRSGKCDRKCKRECIYDSKRCDKIWLKTVLAPKKYSIFYMTVRPENKILWDIAENYSKNYGINKDLRDCYAIAKAIIEGVMI